MIPALKNKKEKGFVVLFTVLIASIILAIAIGTSGIAYKELVLSSAARESHYSFFAADTGAECALYWDITQNAFDTTQSPPPTFCDNIPLNLAINVNNDYVFSLPLANDTSCAVVTVNKDEPDPQGGSDTYTQIRSLGYNASCLTVANLQSSSAYSKIVERAIEINYLNPTP